MTAVAVVLAAILPPWLCAAEVETAPPEALALLDEALALAQSMPEGPYRSDALGRVAIEMAEVDAKRARDLIAGEPATHVQSEAMAAAAARIAQDNQFLGLATLIRIGDRSAALGALARILALEAVRDLDEALMLVGQIDLLTVRRIVQREMTRIIWTEADGDLRQAVETAVTWAERIDDPVTRNEALAFAAEGAAHVDLQMAAEIADRLPMGDARDVAWRLVIVAVSGSDARAGRQLLGRLDTPFERNLAAARVVAGLVTQGHAGEALMLAEQVRRAVGEQLEDPRDAGLILKIMAEAVADIDAPLALSMLTEIFPPVRRYALQARIAAAQAQLDDAARRELLQDAWVEVGRMDSPALRAEIAEAGLMAAARVAPDLIQEWAEERPGVIEAALPSAVRRLAQDHPELALKLAERIDDVDQAEWARCQVALAVVGTRPEEAAAIVEGLESPGPKSAGLAALASGLLAQRQVD